MVGELRDDAEGCAARAKAWGTPHRSAPAGCLTTVGRSLLSGTSFSWFDCWLTFPCGAGGDCGAGQCVWDRVGRLSINPLCIKKN